MTLKLQRHLQSVTLPSYDDYTVIKLCLVTKNIAPIGPCSLKTMHEDKIMQFGLYCKLSMISTSKEIVQQKKK